MEKASKKLPILLLVTGCVAGGVIGLAYNKVTTSTEYIFAKTGKNIYTDTKAITNTNQVFTDTLDILDDGYKIGVDSTSEYVGLSANYDSVVDTYNFNFSLLGFETGFSLDGKPFTISSENSKITPQLIEKIEELKTQYKQQLITLILTSDSTNLKYVGEEDFDREITFTVSADELNLIYTGYTSALREILSEDILDSVEVTAGDDFGFNLKDGLIGSMLRNQIDKYVDNFIQSKLFSDDVVITLNTKKGVISKAQIESADRVLSGYFDPKNLLNSESTVTYTNNDDVDLTLKINTSFTEDLWALDLNINSNNNPSDSYEVSYKWDLVATTDNFKITKKVDGEVEEKVFTVSGDELSGITLEGDKFDFYLEKIATLQ